MAALAIFDFAHLALVSLRPCCSDRTPFVEPLVMRVLAVDG